MNATRVAYEVRSVSDQGPGVLVGKFGRIDAAKRRAEDTAHDYHYGTVICRSDGLYDFGDGSGWEAWPSPTYEF
jgi:hypothetical protein